jgi:high-affinity iron transporter
MMKRLLAPCLSLLCLAAPVQADIQSLLQLVDYMGVDYPEAVQNGEVVNEFEYEEMVEFAQRIRGEIDQLDVSPATNDLVVLSEQLTLSVDTYSDASDVADLTQSMRQVIMENFDLVLTPSALPDLGRAAVLYAENCASCHGETGHGDGIFAAGLEPLPTDFHDRERASQRSIYGLFNTITLGVEGTPMPATASLDDSDRWSLAFYVGGFIDDPTLLENGAAAWEQDPISLTEAVTLTPNELSNLRQAGEALALWVRKNPGVLFAGRSEPLQVSRDFLSESLSLYRDGDADAAEDAAVTAYLEGFELIEAPLQNIDAGLMRRAETAMMDFRNAVSRRAPLDEIESLYNAAIVMLDEADNALSGEALSPGVAFSGSLIILLREGLEIILILAAIITLLIRSKRSDALKYVHAGWILALVAGVGTWAVSSYLFTISGATREITEGITALAAAVILLYVGYWLHRNASTQRWTQFLTSKVKSALTARTLWTLALVSFLAVYREIFEIILFYQALWAQVTAESHSAVFYGAVTAVVLLALTVWLIFKFGMRLPLKEFFSISAILLITLAFIFTGKGIAALQEAGSVAINPVPGPTIDLLGIYPNLQVLIPQALIILLTIFVYVYDRKQQKKLI